MSSDEEPAANLNVDGQKVAEPKVKKAKRSASKKPAATKSAGEKTRRPPARPYPTYSLEKALVIANAIKEKNAGNPWAPTQVAKAIGIGEKSSALDAVTRASQLYGLTTGTRSVAAISLEKLGRDIVYAPSADSEIEARRRAFLNVDIFAKVLEYYKGNNLPDFEFLSNTLQAQFSLYKDFHEEFRDVFLDNCRFCNIGTDWGGIESTPTNASRDESRTAAPAIKSFAASENRTGNRCFVIMPFSERNDARELLCHYAVLRAQ